MEKTIIATNETIRKIVDSEIERLGNNADLNHIDVSQVTDMRRLFEDSEFNGDISKWLPMMKKNGIKLDDLGLQIKEDTWNDIEV